MDKFDILKENLCIEKFLTVLEQKNTSYRKPSEVNGRHSDAFFYVISGSCNFKFDDGTQFTANAGDVFYLPQHSVYTIYSYSPVFHFILCNFKFAVAPVRAAIFPAEKLKNTESLFIKLLNLNRSSSLNKYTESMSILYNIYNSLQKSGQVSQPEKSKNAKINQAKKYMDENFTNGEISIPLLAEQSGVSEVYFRKLFKEQNGISPAKYLNVLRLNHAKGLMRLPFLSLEECAKQSGFSSLQYFCRIFKKEFHITPGKYRDEI